MGLSIVAVFLYAGSLSTADIVGAQAVGLVRLAAHPELRRSRSSSRWSGETNRAPFDLPEAESRAGRRLPHRVLVAEVRAVLPRRVRQHGHRLRAGHDAVPRRLAGAVAAVVGPARTPAGGRCSGSSIKVVIFLFVFIWLRGTLPRLRYDQFMRFGWKVLVPLSAALDPRGRSRLRDLPHRSAAATSARRAADAGASWSPAVLAGRVPGAGPPTEPEAPEVELAVGLPGAPAGPRGPRAVPAAAAARSGGARRRRGRRRRPARGTVGAGAARRRVRPDAATSGASTREQPSSMFDFVQGVRRHLRDDVQEGGHRAVPVRDSRPTAPRYHGRHMLNRHPDGLEKCVGLRAVRLGLPGRRHLRRGRRQHRGGPLLPG